MFRRLSKSLPPDTVVTADLTKLGYFVTEDDYIRLISNPQQRYQYKVNRNERVNDVYKEAMNTCTRNIVIERLLKLGLDQVRLPIGAAKDEKHIPILVSNGVKEKEHVILILPDRQNDPGILSYRVIGEEGINQGSLVDVTNTILHGAVPLKPRRFTRPSADTVLSTDHSMEAYSNFDQDIAPLTVNPVTRPGLIVANPSQNVWYRGGTPPRAVTYREWSNLPRTSAVHEAMQIDPVKNYIQGQEDYQSHTVYLLDHVLSSTQGLISSNPSTKISVIGTELPGSFALQHICRNWSVWSARINCVTLLTPQHTLAEIISSVTDPTNSSLQSEITHFLSARTRCYRISSRPLETPLPGRSELGSNVYSAGESLYDENAFIRCWPSVLDFIDICYQMPEHEEPVFEVEVPEDESGEKIGEREMRALERRRREQGIDLELSENGVVLGETVNENGSGAVHASAGRHDGAVPAATAATGA